MNQTKKIIISVVFLLMGVFSGAQVLKVMTYNIRLDVAIDGENDWTHRKNYFASQIKFYEPDIFGVQEAKPNQVIDIATSLLHYNYIGIGREGIGKGESSNIFYKKDRFIVKESNTFWLSETPNKFL